MLTFIEICSGAGGMCFGTSDAGFEPLALIDNDRRSCETLRLNLKRRGNPFRFCPVVECNVRDFDFRHFAGGVDLLLGGPPCQPFSAAGQRQGVDDTRDLFSQAIRAVRELRPRAFIFENVKGLANGRFAAYRDYIRLQLTFPHVHQLSDEDWHVHFARLKYLESKSVHVDDRYNVEMGVLNAADFGIPQRRERLFFVGFRADTSVAWKFPAPTHSRDALLWAQWRQMDYWQRHRTVQPESLLSNSDLRRALEIIEEPATLPWVTVREAIADLPQPTLANSLEHRLRPGARAYPGHTGSPMDWPSKTIKAGCHGVAGGENMLCYPDGSVRYFTIRECARMQSFPDDFQFECSSSEAIRQIGNAVPVRLASILAENVRLRLETSASFKAQRMTRLADVDHMRSHKLRNDLPRPVAQYAAQAHEGLSSGF